MYFLTEAATYKLIGLSTKVVVVELVVRIAARKAEAKAVINPRRNQMRLAGDTHESILNSLSVRAVHLVISPSSSLAHQTQ